MEEKIDNAILNMVWDLPKDATIEINKHKSSTMKTFAPSCIWWNISHQSSSISVYYDPNDTLGYVGSPYFECYFPYPVRENGLVTSISSDTERFMARDTTELFKRIQEVIEDMKKAEQTNPEYFL